MLIIISCQCGSSDSLIRGFLKSVGYADWLSIPINKGKEASISAINNLPPAPEKDMLKSFLNGVSKWAVIIGYNDTMMRWSDIAHNGAKSRIEAEFVVKTFSSFDERDAVL